LPGKYESLKNERNFLAAEEGDMNENMISPGPHHELAHSDLITGKRSNDSADLSGADKNPVSFIKAVHDKPSPEKYHEVTGKTGDLSKVNPIVASGKESWSIPDEASNQRAAQIEHENFTADFSKENPILPNNIRETDTDEVQQDRKKEIKRDQEVKISPVDKPGAMHIRDKRDIHFPEEKSQGAFGEPPGASNRGSETGRPAIPGYLQEDHDTQVIKVRIGQINGRAVIPSAPVTIQKPVAMHKPVMTLEDYLKQKNKKSS
jgi:hypothetical protein